MRKRKRKITRTLICRHFDRISDKALQKPTVAKHKAMCRLAIMFHNFVE